MKQFNGLYFPTLAIFTSNVLICFFKISDFHIITIPKQFLTSVILYILYSFFSKHITTDGQITHKYGFSHWTSIVKRRSQGSMFFTVKSSLTSFNPFTLMSVF